MNKEEFFKRLEAGLTGLSDADRAEVLQYYMEYFEDAGPEKEAAVIEELGEPELLAKQAAEMSAGAGSGTTGAAREIVPANGVGETANEETAGAFQEDKSAGKLPSVFRTSPDGYSEDGAKGFDYNNPDMPPFKEIEVKVRNCPITVEESPDGRYGICVHLNLNPGGRAEAVVKNGVLTVKQYGSGSSFSFSRSVLPFMVHHGDGGLFNSAPQKQQYVILRLPKTEYDRIHLDTSNAAITVRCRIQVRDEVILDTSNSSIRAEKIAAGGSISADSSNGAIHFLRVRAKELLADTSNGAVTMEDAVCVKGVADTSNGQISLRNCRVEKYLKADTSNGRIEAELPGTEADYHVYADTSNASIHVNGNKKGRSYSTDSGKCEVILDTSNGGISIRYI